MTGRSWRACGHSVEAHDLDDCPGGGECERCGEMVPETDAYGLCPSCAAGARVATLERLRAIGFAGRPTTP